jgi:hypothetical protein
VAASFRDWLEKDLERRSATQRTQIEAAKLLATLAVATAAAFIASALQSGHSRTQDVVAVCLIAAAFAAVIAVVLLDRSTVVDHEAMIVGAMLGNFDGEKELKELEQASIVSVLNNDTIVGQVKAATGVTLLLAATAAAFAVASLL